ncbi:MAG: dihydrofolate reductase family protein [Pedococcus sp.]
MGTLVSNFFISLDGVVESPHEWHFPYFDDRMGAVVGEGMQTSAAFLMGRRLYDEWSLYWTTEGEDEPFSEFINSIPKFVVSNTLDAASWANTTVVRADLAAVQAVKDSVDGQIGISGSPSTVRWLLTGGLLDRLNLLVHPIVVGHGERLFTDDATYPLELTNSETLPTGVLNLSYAPV